MDKYDLWCNTMTYINNKYNRNIFKKFVKESESVNSAIIIEPRCHEHFESVLKNFASKLHGDWSLYIFHGINNEQYIKDIIGDNTNIILCKLNVENLTVYEYSDLLLDINFWLKINAEHILIFQTDCLLRNDISDFLQYDYIGAPWNEDNICIKTTKTFVGNGGLSIRSKKATITILSIINPQFKSNNKMTEDIFYSIWMKKLNMNIPSKEIASQFSSEHIYNQNSHGLHKIYKYLTYEQLKTLLNVNYF